MSSEILKEKLDSTSVITVKKNGIAKKVPIDEDANENLCAVLRKMTKKDKCGDYFKDTTIEVNN